MVMLNNSYVPTAVTLPSSSATSERPSTTPSTSSLSTDRPSRCALEEGAQPISSRGVRASTLGDGGEEVQGAA